jgi:excisionase family DNA binding protein
LDERTEDAAKDMSRTRPNTTDATGHDATECDSATMILSVADAAQLLGVSPGAIRKRIERGQLPARKVAGQWRVILDTTGHDATGTTSATRPDVTTRHDEDDKRDSIQAPPASAREQLEAIRDEWLAPLVAQISEQAEMIGQLRERAGRLQAERDELRTRLEVLSASQVVPESQDERSTKATSIAFLSRPEGPGGGSGSHPRVLPAYVRRSIIRR